MCVKRWLVYRDAIGKFTGIIAEILKCKKRGGVVIQLRYGGDMLIFLSIPLLECRDFLFAEFCVVALEPCDYARLQR
jgi:hypothetical protein